jgi:hypothetical protein
MDDAAGRIVKERTAFADLYLKQFYTFGNTNRTRDPTLDQITKEMPPSVVSWLKGRFITTGYLSFVHIPDAAPQPDALSDRCEWMSLHSLPDLAQDHAAIIEKALHALRMQLNYVPIGKALLPKKFTLKDLQKIYEQLLGKALDRGNFQKKMLKLGILTRHEKLKTGAANKAPWLYSFEETTYNDLVQKGIGYL